MYRVQQKLIKIEDGVCNFTQLRNLKNKEIRYILLVKAFSFENI